MVRRLLSSACMVKFRIYSYGTSRIVLKSFIVLLTTRREYRIHIEIRM